MIDDAAPYGPPPVPPPAGVLGLGGRALGRAAAAGVVAEVGFLAVLAALALGTQRLLGRCVGDSCMGDPSTYVAILSSPFVAFAALVVAFLRFGLPRAWAVAGVAVVVALVLLAGAAAVALGGLEAGGAVVVPVAVVAALFGPVSAVTATALVNGRGALRFVPAPAVVLLVVLAVVGSQLRAPALQAARITAVVPLPYAYGVPGVELYSLNLNGFTHVLELGYSVGDRFVDVHESGPLPADVRAAACSPTLQLGEPDGLCHRLPAPDGVGIWRQQDPGDPQLAGAAASYVVVARPDVTLVVFSTAISDDASALVVVADLRPTDARTLLDTATSVSVQ